MTEQAPGPSPEQLLQLKDEILQRWQQLPGEHRATMTLVFLKKVLESDHGDWLRQALLLTVLSPKSEENQE